MRSYGRSEGLNWGVWVLIAALLLVAAGGIALAVYGSQLEPQQREVEQVLPNDRFPS